jgi:hypothetical protein
MPVNPRDPGSDSPWSKIGALATIAGLFIAGLGIYIAHLDAGPASGGSAAAHPTNAPSLAGPTDSGPSSETEAPATSRSGSFTLNEGYSVVLDTDSPNWNVKNGCGDCDLWLTNGLLGGYGGSVAELSGSQTPDYATCSAATQYQQQISEDSLSDGLGICVRTTHGNFAGVIIKEIKRNESNFISGVTFSAVSWRNG